ncbi:MAG: serine/threonine protein kinase [Oscillatoria princeps RMCB-10]|jgi:serine/threonine protein kinase|nr:serine/threonine protein kinase [Oscillatoria princeps RMCB-10]
MSDFPDFSGQGYQVVRELGHNSLGGRVTFQATHCQRGVPVVIKQFQFAQLGASWAEYEAFEQEIKVLRSLNHPGIPHYLDSFQTPDGFCMVQEYKDAECLATRRSFSPQEIKQIAVAVLEILVYLQSQKPPVIHRDIKPENILVDDKINVYLVDFGFARTGGGEVAASSVVKGTLGFMPPEQLFNRQLTEASDLYGLGAALICSLTGTHSGEIGNLIDDSYRIHFQHLVPPLQRGWMNWLEKMVEPKPQQRYPNAAAALLALKPVDVNSLPKVRLSKESLEFTASEFGEKVTQTIGVSNPIPDTVLAGRWEVVPHVSDPPHTPYDHAWISFQPMRFESNQAECKITVDTSRLRAGEIYSRQIILRTNSEPDTHAIDVKVQTAPLPEPQKPEYFLLAMVFAVFCGAGCWLGFNSPIIIFPGFIAAFAAVDQILMASAAGVEVDWVKVMVVALLGQFVVAAVFGVFSAGWDVGLLVGGVIGALYGAGSGARPDRPIVLGKVVMSMRNLSVLLCLVMFLVFVSIFLLMPDIKILLLMMIAGIAAVCLFLTAASNKLIQRGFQEITAAKLPLLTAGFGVALGALYPLILIMYDNYLPYTLYHGKLSELANIIFINIAAVAGALAAVAVTGVPLIYGLIYQPFKRGRLIAKYRRDELHLIKP